MKTLYLDCFSGISGDMTVGALIDAGADFEVIAAALASLKAPGFHVAAERVKKKGIMATQFRVVEDEAEAHPHRHLRHVVEIINGGDLPAPVKEAAIATFERLADAEAAVHGSTREKVHFHEVGAVDAIADIVAAQLGFHLLGVERVVCSPLNVGSGTVTCAHGVMPVPAPATALLLQGMPTRGGEVAAELVTPTGAAIVAHRAAAFGPPPAMTVSAIGYGSGTRDLPDRPNVLRVMLGECADAPLESPGLTPITVLETTIDDMNPELYPPLIEALLEAGARDATLTPMIGKKGRPAHGLTVLCEAGDAPALAALVAEHSTTLGVRVRHEERYVLARKWAKAETPWGSVRVKLARWRDDAPWTVAPEFEDCRRVAAERNAPVRRVYEAALAAGLKGALEDVE